MWNIDLRKTPFREMRETGQILTFPKRKGFTKKKVDNFRKKELNYPLAWEIKETKTSYLLVYSKHLFRKHYTNYYDVQSPYV